MPKIITTTSLRHGLGRTTTACLTGMELAKLGFKILIIDNNYKFNDVCQYLMVDSEYSIDDIKPFLEGKMLDEKTLTNIVTKVDTNLYVLAGSKLDTLANVLSAENILEVQRAGEKAYDYIIVDSRAGIDQQETLDLADKADCFLIVGQANKNAQRDLKTQLKRLDSDKKDLVAEIVRKSYLVLNRFTDEIDYDLSHLQKKFGNDNIFKIHYSSKLIDFANGFKLTLDAKNDKEMKALIKRVINNEIPPAQQKKGLGMKIRSIIGAIQS